MFTWPNMQFDFVPFLHLPLEKLIYFNVKKAFAKTSTAVAAEMSLSFMFETLGLRPPTGLK